MTPEEFWAVLQAPVATHPVFYRLYHDDAGVPLFYSMEDLPGTYIELTQEQYHNTPSNVRVRDGVIVALTWQTTTKLIPSNSGSFCHPDNVAVIVAGNQPHIRWNQKTYETN